MLSSAVSIYMRQSKETDNVRLFLLHFLGDQDIFICVAFHSITKSLFVPCPLGNYLIICPINRYLWQEISITSQRDHQSRIFTRLQVSQMNCVQLPCIWDMHSILDCRVIYSSHFFFPTCLLNKTKAPTMDKVRGNINGFSFATSLCPCRGLIIRQCSYS